MKLSSGPHENLRELNQVIDSLPPHDAEAVRSWLASAGKGRQLSPQPLVMNHEPVGSDLFRPEPGDPRAIRTVGVIGGGTAGYLAALALRVKRPWLDVSLVESRSIPVIGVGEATVTEMVWFLHHYLNIDPAEFYRAVEPTWKLGIKFDWGPHPAGFTAPFDWSNHSIGMLGALAGNGSVDGFSLGSLLMMADKIPVMPVDGQPVSLLKYLPFAYHLENAAFVKYLTSLAERRGVRHVEATIEDVRLASDGWIDHLKTSDGRSLSYDFYIDCTGFRSRLLGQALEVPFESYSGTLFTDSAVTGDLDHNGHIKPYTTATTMDSGWCWTIPVPDADHVGYVYSSQTISDEQAVTELTTRFPGISEPRLIRFRSGRHAEAWRGNVMAIGNAHAFVEPLESSALAMVSLAVRTLVSVLPPTWSGPADRDAANAYLAGKWDELRWFLGIHYRFNTRLDSKFWKWARAETDVSGLQPLLDVFSGGAPLARRHGFLRRMVEDVAPPFYGLGGVDNILLGQQVPARRLPSAEPAERWHERRRAAQALLQSAMPQRAALEAFRSEPRLLAELFGDDDSWLGPLNAQFLLK